MALDIPNQEQLTQSQSPTTNQLSAQAHLCSLQRLDWRSMVSMDGAKQSDWWKLTKFVEFAYRRMYIPGTNLTPFMVARGRQPTVPSELERLQTGGAKTEISGLTARVPKLPVTG